MKKTIDTKQKILRALEDTEKIHPFKIEIEGDSGNTNISHKEQDLIKEQLAKVLFNRNIDDFDIKFYA